jgi:hypothetical protein
MAGSSRACCEITHCTGKCFMPYKVRWVFSQKMHVFQKTIGFEKEAVSARSPNYGAIIANSHFTIFA